MKSLTRAEVIARYSFLFEHRPWIVEAAADRAPFEDADTFYGTLMWVIEHAPPEALLDLLRAHPKLADKAAISAGLTTESASEQASAGLDRLAAQEFDRFQTLNAAYETKFGFPFIVAVRLAGGKAGILAAMQRRLDNDRDTEFRTAISEVMKIVRLRLQDTLDVPADREGALGHTARVHHDLETLNIGTFEKVPDGGICDVLIVGGGQSGLGTAFGLLRERVARVLILDENPEGLEGPWETYARMVTLRTPKHLTAIDLGIPSLTFRAFWEARHGLQGWEALDKIPRGDWMAYLRWYRRVLNMPVKNGTRVTLISPPKQGVYTVETTQGTYRARRVILATGIQGGGEWHVPALIRESLPANLYAHTSQAIDFTKLKGRRIAILGGGASAFDNAHHALMEGVAEAHVFVRRAQLPTVNPIRHMEAAGLVPRFGTLADADKYAFMAAFFKHNQPPTNDTFSRSAALPGFHLHTGAPWESVEQDGDAAIVTTPHGQERFDFLIVSTGLITDPALRPELRLLEGGIRRWRDVYEAPEGIRNPLIDDHPYLTPEFKFTGRSEAAEAALSGLYAFNYSALVSCGLSASALSGLKYALPRLCVGIADSLFRDECEAKLSAYFAYDEPEFTSEWRPQ